MTRHGIFVTRTVVELEPKPVNAGLGHLEGEPDDDVDPAVILPFEVDLVFRE